MTDVKMKQTDYQCDDCKRSFHTEHGLRYHEDRDACV